MLSAVWGTQYLAGPVAAMNLSQCLDDLPLGSRWPATPPDLYSESQRLALEELLSGGPEALRLFLQKEKVPGFLSEPEVGEILSAAAAVQCGEDEVSVSASRDCSSVTYYPEVSDVEPPLLELGWPAFSAGSYRGVTRVDVHFQPGFGETIYSCKEAARSLIKAAREVIAVVMDAFTDNDIFRDIHEVCRKRRVPVYILLDEAQLPHFLTMCQNLGVSIESEQLMRVRTLTGNNYYTRSGAKIVGKAREKFLLVDGLKVATGSYSFTWMDGKLNSSNMVTLTGQVVEKFDLQFRVLYAQSKPINTKLISSIRNQSKSVAKMTCNLAAPRNTLLSTLLHLEMAKVSSTPKRIITEPKPIWDKNRDSSMKASAFDDDLMQNCEIISGLKETQSVATQTEPCVGLRTVEVVNATTQTNVSTSTAGTQTAVLARVASTQTMVLSRSTTTQTASASGTSAGSTQTTSNSSTSRLSSSSFTSLSTSSSASSTGSSTSGRSFDITGSNLNLSDYPMRDSFQKLTKERQYHYTSIRSKLDHMVSILSRRSRLANTFMTCEPTRYGLQRSVMHNSMFNLRDGVRFTHNI